MPYTLSLDFQVAAPNSRSLFKNWTLSTEFEMKSQIACHGTLKPEVASAIATLQVFFMNREKLMSKLFGRALRRSAFRDELLRTIMLEFARDQHRRMAFYIRACSSQATAPSVRSELDLLAAAGLIELVREPFDMRATLVMPTTKLVDFYNNQMPRLRDEVYALLLQNGVPTQRDEPGGDIQSPPTQDHSGEGRRPL